MRNQKTKLKRIDHRNMPKNLTNLENLLAQYKNPRTEPTEEENDDIDFAEIKTDDDNNVIKISYITQEFNKVKSTSQIWTIYWHRELTQLKMKMMTKNLQKQKLMIIKM